MSLITFVFLAEVRVKTQNFYTHIQAFSHIINDRLATVRQTMYMYKNVEQHLRHHQPSYIYLNFDLWVPLIYSKLNWKWKLLWKKRKKEWKKAIKKKKKKWVCIFKYKPRRKIFSYEQLWGLLGPTFNWCSLDSLFFSWSGIEPNFYTFTHYWIESQEIL